MGCDLVNLYSLIHILQNDLNSTREHKPPPLNEVDQLVQAWVQKH